MNTSEMQDWIINHKKITTSSTDNIQISLSATNIKASTMNHEGKANWTAEVLKINNIEYESNVRICYVYCHSKTIDEAINKLYHYVRNRYGNY